MGSWVYARPQAVPNRLVLRFRFSERVPRHNLHRRLAELLDWSFLYGQTRDL